MQRKKAGTLYIVATPIGNLKDITLRAIEVLKQVDRIAAEDTRHAAPLLKHFSILKPTISLHAFNEAKRSHLIIDALKQGEDIALISDAGTPLISDPGYRLVHAASAEKICIVPIPGPCAAIAALSVSGLPSDKFVFEGFLPAKQIARCNRLEYLAKDERTLIFYEAPHRIAIVLKDMLRILGSDRKAVLAKELTKLHETVCMGTLAELEEKVTSDSNLQRGEMVILIEGSKESSLAAKEAMGEEVLQVLLSELPLKQAVHLTSKITGARKNKLYNIALHKK